MTTKTVEELQKENADLHRIIREFTQRVPRDMPWPKGIGYWDGITAEQNEREGNRRREARI